jgi:hypothetical protein
MEKKLEFHFKGGSAESYQLPVELMINLLANIKELTYLVIAQMQGVSKLSKQIKDNYVIKCELPEKGSYVQSLTVDYVGKSKSEEDEINIIEKLENTMQSIADYDESKILHYFPDDNRRRKVLSCIKNAFPQSDSEIYVEMASGKTKIKPIINSRTIQKNITPIIDKMQAKIEEYMTVVTGHLAQIDFYEKKIVIMHPMTKHSLNCFYNEGVEDMLFDNRRQLVQITGLVEFDDNDQPKKITNAISIQEIDLSPIKFDYIDYEDKKLKFKNRLVLTPELDDSNQLYTISYPDFNLYTFAYTRQEIIEDLKSDIAFLWDTYAKAADEDLTKGALEIKQKLLSSIEESSNG